MSTLKEFVIDALTSGGSARANDNFNLAQTQERARFRKSMHGEMAVKEATRLFANGR